MTLTRMQRPTYLLTAILFLCIVLITASCAESPEETTADAARERERNDASEFLAGRDAPVYGYELVATYGHGTADFTQGLDLDEGIIYEGTGLRGRSRLLKTDFATGMLLGSLSLAPEYFGEGVTVLGDEVFQLTYTSGTGFVYDKETLELKRNFDLATQGWGLTHDGESLILSDGTATMYFLDPASGNEKGRIGVSDNLGPVSNLNELEYLAGEVYANVWRTDIIAIISAATGEVTGWIDLSGLNPDPRNLVDPYVLNGIAYRAETGNLLVTGKRWPDLFEISISPRPD